jgi:hypothetical protein
VSAVVLASTRTKVELHAATPFSGFDNTSSVAPPVVVEGATVTSIVTTMLGIGLVLNTLGIGLFCWLIFELAVYALAFFVAVSIGRWRSVVVQALPARCSQECPLSR